MQENRNYRHQELTERIIGIFYDVYNELGHGFLESVYENAMVLALSESGISCQAQHPISVRFRGRIVGDFRADILVENCVLLELKCAKTIDEAHVAQTLNYLKATDIDVALLLNFGPQPSIKRLFFDQ